MKLMKHPWIFLLLSFTIIIVIKIPHLELPFFLDEAYSYYRAIREMAKTGPGILPGALPLDSSKGHPLLFYFVSSSWIKYIAGESFFLIRILPLIISLFALYVFHRFAKKHINILIANIAVVLLSVQTLFLAQASLLLPEILLLCLFMLCFDNYLSGNYRQYALFGSLMMLTKETGAVFIFIFGLSYFVGNYKNYARLKFWKELALLSVPAFVYALFLVLHYLKFGVFLYAEHIGYITVESSKIIYKFNSATSILFLKHGRNLVSFTGILSLIYLLIRRKKIENKKFLLITLATLLIFLTFSIVNFYTYRYVIPVMGISLLASLSLIQQAKTKYRFINLAYIVLIIGVSGYYTATKRGQSDADLGYAQFLPVYKQITEYCEQQGWYDKEIGAGFNLVMGMRDQFTGFLNTGKTFHMHHLPGIEKRDLIIYDSTCWPHEMLADEKVKLELIKRFEYKKHWGEIYKVRQ